MKKNPSAMVGVLWRFVIISLLLLSITRRAAHCKKIRE